MRVGNAGPHSINVTGTLGRAVHFYGGGGGRGAKFGIENNDLKDTRMPRGELVVTVPRKAHVWVKMTDGDVIATHTAGELEVITVTRTITVRRTLAARRVGGDTIGADQDHGDLVRYGRAVAAVVWRSPRSTEP